MALANLTLQKIQPSIENLFNTPVLYPVKAGDSLSKIIINFYQVPYGSLEYKAAVEMLMLLNPSLSSPDHIRVGQLLRLNSRLDAQQVKALCEAPKSFYQQARDEHFIVRHPKEPSNASYINGISSLVPFDPVELDAFSKLAWLTENYGLMSIPAGAAFNTVGGLTSNQFVSLIDEVKIHYNHYKQGVIKSHQYDYRRRVALQKLAQKLGPFEQFMFKGQTAAEAIRIDRAKAIPATQTIEHYAQRLRQLSSVARNGGIILTGIGVAASCHQIAITDNQHQKNEIFVEAFLSTTVGTATGIGLALLFASTPVGWITIIGLGTTAALAGYAGGKGAIKAYNSYGNKIDLVNLSGINNICKK